MRSSSSRSTPTEPGRACCTARPSWPRCPITSTAGPDIASGTGVTAASAGLARSLSDISTAGSSSGIGQAIASAGSPSVDLGVAGVGPPVRVDEVGVRRAVLQHLVGVADAARHEDGGVRADLGGEAGAEARPLAQVDPGAEDPPRRERDVLVPGLGVDAARDTTPGVEGDVVLDRAEVGPTGGDQLGALPVLLEGAAGVRAQVQVDDQQSRDRGGAHRGQAGAGLRSGSRSLTAPSGRTTPRSAACAVATRPRWRGTTRRCRPGPGPGRSSTASSPAPRAAGWSRSRSAGRARRGR